MRQYHARGWILLHIAQLTLSHQEPLYPASHVRYIKLVTPVILDDQSCYIMDAVQHTIYESTVLQRPENSKLSLGELRILLASD